MLTETRKPWAIVVLLEDLESAESLALMLTDLASAEAKVIARVPPVRGMEFFSDSAAQRQLDAWWDAQIPADASVIFVVADREGLAEWLVGLDGSCYVGIASGEPRPAPDRGHGVRTFNARTPLDYAAAVMSDLVDAGAYDEVEAQRLRELASSLPDENSLDVSGRTVGEPAGESRPDPFDLLIAMSLDQSEVATPNAESVAPGKGDERAHVTRGFRLPSWTRLVGSRRNGGELSDAEWPISS